MEAPSERLLMSFYGDDFTGSTDAMEALTLSGIKTVLFLEPPTKEQLASRFPDIRAFGVAGVSRAMGPEQMERELRPLLERLACIETTIVHYKICSTFDSSPSVGSIGYVMDMAAEIFHGQSYIPLLVGAPVLKRYTVFGQHFATAGQDTIRLDRHPTMSRHPVTPMNESDLRVHLAKQTNKSIVLMDILALNGDDNQVEDKLTEKESGYPDVILFDVLDDVRLQRAGRLIWEKASIGGKKNRFVVGSSGVEYALAAHWQQTGRITGQSEMATSMGPVDRMIVVSGSCSPVTEAQIRYALDHGFIGIRIDTDRLIDPNESQRVRSELQHQVTELLKQGKSPVLYTAMGPEDAGIEAVQQRLIAAGYSTANTGHLIGEQLGRLTKEIIAENKLRRFVIAGGDTSGFVTKELGIYAMECLMPIAPGGPLCRGYSEDDQFNEMEFALKGGQVGREDYFVRVLAGK